MESCIRAPERVLQEEQVGNRLLPAIHVGKKDTTLSQLPKTCFLWVSSPPGSLSVYQQALSTLPWSCILNPCVSARLSRWRKGKESACRYRRHTDAGSIPRWGRSPGGGNGNPPPQYPCMENPMDRGAWRASVLAVAEGPTWLNRHGAPPASLPSL